MKRARLPGAVAECQAHGVSLDCSFDRPAEVGMARHIHVAVERAAILHQTQRDRSLLALDRSLAAPCAGQVGHGGAGGRRRRRRRRLLRRATAGDNRTDDREADEDGEVAVHRDLPAVWNECCVYPPAASKGRSSSVARSARLLDVGTAASFGIATKVGLRHCSKCITLSVKLYTHLKAV